ncbi:hypothetical protein TYRP_012825 [Tyrophagus putrescentiae]|nr:hypothetical protein TYRP_012825 [Tyrophagus putrescentiae]
MPQEAEEPEPELEAMVAAAARVTAVLERELHPPNPQPSAQAHPKQQRRRRLILPTLPAEVAAEERCYCRDHRGADRNTRRGLLHKGSRSETTVEPTFLSSSSSSSAAVHQSVLEPRFHSLVPSAAWSSSEDHLTINRTFSKTAAAAAALSCLSDRLRSEFFGASSG